MSLLLKKCLLTTSIYLRVADFRNILKSLSCASYGGAGGKKRKEQTGGHIKVQNGFVTAAKLMF